MSEVEVHVSVGGETKRVGTLCRHAGESDERVTFEYCDSWLSDPERFPIDPDLPLAKGEIQATEEYATFRAFLDSTADSWGREILSQAESMRAKSEGRAERTLQETDFLLSVPDDARHGALRFREPGSTRFLSASRDALPGRRQLGALIECSRRFEGGEATEGDVDLLLQAGSALGGARPKAAIIDEGGIHAVAKFPAVDDSHSVETWEHVACVIAARAGIAVARHRLLQVGGTPVFVSERFDREGGRRIPFMTAMTLLQAEGWDCGSYPEIVDELSRVGGRVEEDAEELFRRMVLNILISNVDDHLRNHGFLMTGRRGWVLSPAYDINPISIPAHWRILSTHISPGIGACSLELALDQAERFRMSKDRACRIAGEVATAVSDWRKVASVLGEQPGVIEKMESAFEHDDLRDGLRLAHGPDKHRPAHRP